MDGRGSATIPHISVTPSIEPTSIEVVNGKICILVNRWRRHGFCDRVKKMAGQLLGYEKDDTEAHP